MRSWTRFALLGSAVPLAACMTTGTNMHGDFACRAPNGTCAPMSSIDAKAVAGLGALAQPVGGIVDPAVPREGRVVTAAADGTPPGRTSDRVLRVVFPAHIDASGIYHDESTAHAVVEHGGWSDGLTGGAPRPTTVAVTEDATAHVHAEDPVRGKLASLDEVIAARAAQLKSAAAAGPTPTPPATAAPGSQTSAPSPSFLPSSYPAPAPARTAGSYLSVTALNLREAAAGAAAGPVDGLDPNFDTPDVRAVAAADLSASGDACVAYRKVRWHGHDYRRPFKVSCPTVTADAAAPATPPMVAGAGAAALNRAALDAATVGRTDSASTSTTIGKVGVAAGSPAIQATAASSTTSSLQTPAIKSPASQFAPTPDPATAAARVSMMAAPIMADQLRLGRLQAKDAGGGIGDLFAGMTGSASTPLGSRP